MKNFKVNITGTQTEKTTQKILIGTFNWNMQAINEDDITIKSFTEYCTNDIFCPFILSDGTINSINEIIQTTN